MQYYTDFSGYTTGQAPDDWSLEYSTAPPDQFEVVADASYPGGKGLQIDAAPGEMMTVGWDIDGGSDLEIVANTRDFEGNSSPILIRGSGDEEANQSAYSVRTDLPQVNKLQGTSNPLLGEGTNSLGVDRWYRFRANGDDISAKTWGLSDSEPASWDVEVTDSDVNSGWAGLQQVGFGAPILVEFGVGTEGDTAPTEPVSADPPAAPTNLQLSEQ